MKKIIIIGTGGHARVLYDSLLNKEDMVVGFFDENLSISEMKGLKVYHSFEEIEDDVYYLIGIGSNFVRERFASKDLNWYTFIHESAIVAQDVVIEEGAMILPNVVINSGAKIGKHCIINTASIVEHDCVVGDFVHISPNATVCGTCEIGKSSWIGASSTIINNKTIASNVIIGAGSLVIEDIDMPGTYVGAPVRKIK